MKKNNIIIILLIIVIAASLCSCKSRAGEQKQKGARENIGAVEAPKPESRAELQQEPESKPTEVDLTSARDMTEAFLKAAKTGDREQIQQYADYNKLFGLEQGQDADWILQQVLMRMKYEILTVEKKDGSDDTAISCVKITNVDMNVVMPLYFERAMELEFNNALSDNPQSQPELEQEYRRIFADVTSKNAEKKIEKLADIELVKKDGGWSMKTDPQIGDAMLGGYLDAREAITQAASIQTELQEETQGGESEETSEIGDDFDYDADEFSMVPPRE